MGKGLFIFLIAMLLRLTATAQVPAQLQVAVSNGIVTVSSTDLSGVSGISELAMTTNLSPPIAWTYYSTNAGQLTGTYFTSPATNSQEFFQLLQSIPIFEFAIFYNLNMEFDPTPVMVINGPVFCNQSMWLVDINGLTFNSTVQAVGTVNQTGTDPFANGYSYGGSKPVTFTLAGQPMTNNAPLYFGYSITNSESILNLPPPGDGAPNFAAYAPSNQVYLFNESDLIISNSANGVSGATGTNITIWFQDQYTPKILNKLTNNVRLLKNTSGTNINNYAPSNILYAGFSFVTNVTFYDWREGWNGGSGPPKTVQAVQIDIAKFNKWLTNTADEGPKWNTTCQNDLGHGIGSIYVYNNVGLSSATLPAVRLINGSTLPTTYPGLTISTPQPLYIYGNYNITNNGSPAALMADAIMILSANWSDSITSKLPSAGNTTVNAAMFSGIVESTGSHYCGGVENFFRFLEDWSKPSQQTFTFNGSIAAMFPSIYATNYFQPGGNYYNPPIRNWAFDTNFTSLSTLPPLTPMVLNFGSP